MGGSISGGAFNPAKVFGPALITGKWDHHLLFWVADFSGAAAGGAVYSFLFAPPH
jgi:glycerol uptake facilitator-like aquaporin